MTNKVMKVGIMPRKKYQARTIAIAKGEYKPKASEPKVWFDSAQSFAQVLSEDNQRLLALMSEKKPKSIKELSTLAGRAEGNLSRTLKTLKQYGIVDLKETAGRGKQPIALATRFDLRLDASLSL